MTYSSLAVKIGQDIAKIFINHRNFSEALDAIGKILCIGNGTDTFSGARVIAPPGTGKTLLLECLRKNAANWPLLKVDVPVIHTSLKESPSVAQIQDGLLKNFNYGLSTAYRKINNNEVNNILVTSIIQYRVRAIALDEFHHVFLANGISVSLAVIDWLKRLMNLTNVPVLLFGTEQMERLAGIDPQLISRIPTTICLRPFKYDEEWIGFLNAFAKQAKEIDINCIHTEFSRELFLCTAGAPRTFKSILVQAAMIAIDDGKFCLEKPHLHLAYCRHFGSEHAMENPF